jgi:hypothetical protein
MLPNQVVCNETNPKGKPCHGGLKRYHPLGDYFNERDQNTREEIRQELGDNPDLILLRCEVCQTVYRLPEELKEKYG